MDFVVNRGMRRWYIQSAFAIPDAAKRLQEMRPFSKIPDSFSRIVIVKDDIKPWIDEHGVLTVGLLDFLLDDELLAVRSASTACHLSVGGGGAGRGRCLGDTDCGGGAAASAVRRRMRGPKALARMRLPLPRKALKCMSALCCILACRRAADMVSYTPRISHRRHRMEHRRK